MIRRLYCFSLLSLLFIAQPVLSAEVQASQGVLINEILFTMDGESLTLRDFKLYRTVLREVFKKERLGEFVIKESEDFLLSRICYREAKTFETQGVPYKLTEQNRKKLSDFTDDEVELESEAIAKAIGLIEIKESQLRQKERFFAWFELVKRKNQVRIKSVDMK